VVFVSREKDVPLNFLRGQNISMTACVLQWSPGTIYWIVYEPIQIEITKHNSYIIYMSSGLQSFVLELHDQVYRISFVE
jgi:hypothetical protein